MCIRDSRCSVPTFILDKLVVGTQIHGHRFPAVGTGRKKLGRDFHILLPCDHFSDHSFVLKGLLTARLTALKETVIALCVKQPLFVKARLLKDVYKRQGGILTRLIVTKRRGKEYFETVFVKKFDGATTLGLLLTLVLIFSFQGNVILENPLHIVLIAVPLILQTFLIFAIAYLACWLLKLPHTIAAPAGMIGASNFFELAVAVAVALFGKMCIRDRDSVAWLNRNSSF